ncbi:hypothetical protein SOM08_14385 [Hydrogenophaga sp. SNF1]|uniref:hypothetical protein n=1 Tax=Hydrogenophaga sp. SNF1 TaxID=3098762 RepID=UPI002ACBDDDA|nr:hypothetical protein [Hydrogenophaga sp. SNF1]WQB82185.1 hypothetical protein SOM08_14385 [Hydrogenophaga sp. SNF1]
MQNRTIKDQYCREYHALIEVGATPEEALAQVAQSNEISIDAVAPPCELAKEQSERSIFS